MTVRSLRVPSQFRIPICDPFIEIYIFIEQLSLEWLSKFGRSHNLSDGDELTVFFTKDQTMSVKYRDGNITLFTDLPKTPLYLVVETKVKKLKGELKRRKQSRFLDTYNFYIVMN